MQTVTISPCPTTPGQFVVNLRKNGKHIGLLRRPTLETAKAAAGDWFPGVAPQIVNHPLPTF